MKNILCLFLLIPSLVLANPLACLNSEELTYLINEYRELPYVRGVSSEGASVVVFVNPATGSFTIAERKGIDTYCALVVGAGFELVPKKLQDEAKQEQEKSRL